MTRARNTADELSLITAKGDLLAGSASGVQSKLAVGSNNTVLTADSTTGTGLKWASATATENFSLLGTGTLTGATTVTVSGISNRGTLFIVIKAASAGAGVSAAIRLNSDSASNYYYAGPEFVTTQTYSGSNYDKLNTSDSSFPVGVASQSADSTVSGYAVIYGCNSSGIKMIHAAGNGSQVGSSYSQKAQFLGGYWNNTSTVSSVSLYSGSGNWDSGTFEVYGSA